MSVRDFAVPMGDDPLEHMRARIDMCRRLAGQINDQQAITILRKMAEEGEADLKRLEAERTCNHRQ